MLNVKIFLNENIMKFVLYTDCYHMASEDIEIVHDLLQPNIYNALTFFCHIAFTSTTNHTWKLQFPLRTLFIVTQTRFWSKALICGLIRLSAWADASCVVWCVCRACVCVCVCVCVRDMVVTCPEVCDILFFFRCQKFRWGDSNLYFNAKSPWRWCESHVTREWMCMLTEQGRSLQTCG